MNKVITLCGKDWAKIGVEFIFLGGKQECEGCRLKNICLRLREGSKYKIVGLRDGVVHDCPLHDEGVVAVEVVELPIMALIDSKVAVEGARVRFERRCDDINCELYNLCNPLELNDGDFVVVKAIVGDPPIQCPRGYVMKIVELERG